MDAPEAPAEAEPLPAREDFGSIFETAAPQGASEPGSMAFETPEGTSDSGSMAFDITEGEDEEEHLEHLRSAEEARKRDEPRAKAPRFDRSSLRSAFIASEVLGKPVSTR